VDKMSQSLRLFSDTLEEWLECQKKWLYLENIFMAPDIQRQLPNETKTFATVDRQFKSILRITRDRPAALQVWGLKQLCPSAIPLDILCICLLHIQLVLPQVTLMLQPMQTGSNSIQAYTKQC